MALNHAQIGLVRQAVTAAGADMPPDVARALDELDRLQSAAQALAPARAVDVADAVAAALLDDRDPFDDEGVNRLLTARQLYGEGSSGITHMVQEAGVRRVVAAIGANVDVIVAALAEAARTAGQHLAESFEVLGDLELDDHANIVRLRDGSAALAIAKDALNLLRRLDTGWTAVAQLAGYADISEPALRLAELDLDQYESVGRRADAWTIVRAGATIDLATAPVLRQRVDRIATQRQHRSETSDDAFSQSYQKMHGMGQAIVG